MNKEQKQKNHWFVLDNYVHIAVKGDNLLCYNSLTGEIVEYDRGGDKSTAPIFTLIKRLHAAKNQGVVRLTPKDISDPAVSSFVQRMRSAFMGDIVDTSLSRGKPVQMLPYLKVHKDVEKIKKYPTRSVGEDMMKYLAEVSIYINRTCSLDCAMCDDAYRQFLCCTRSSRAGRKGAGQGKEEMDIAVLTRLMEQLKGLPQLRLNILGGNIFAYTQLDVLLDLLGRQSSSFKFVFYSHFLNLPVGEGTYFLFPPASSIAVVVDLPVLSERGEQWQRVMEARRICLARGIGMQFHFIIASETDFTEAEELIDTFQLADYQFRPFYNGANREFFEQNVFLDKDDILEARPGMREIIARQMVNPLHFGTMTIMSNGDIFANVNMPRLGTVESGGVSDAVYREMYRGKSWRRIRKRVEPCKRCVFEALCPPLSNYEYALGCSNLCFKGQ